MRSVFQVVPPCGGHPEAEWKLWSEKSFKSCPRVGGIFSVNFPSRCMASFKSCPRVGGILKLLHCPDIRFVSSRAPVWGASLAAHQVGLVSQFQVVPPCGGHLARVRPGACTYPFQVVPPCGGHQKYAE